MPPVASTVSRAWIRRSRPRGSTTSAPATPTPDNKSSARQPHRTSTCAALPTADHNATVIASPLRSPATWATRARRCPASRCRLRPAPSRSKSTPVRSRNVIASAADPITRVTAAGSAEWPAAATVSPTCRCTESSEPTGAAMPPWASALQELRTGASGHSSRVRRGAVDSAAHSPAAPAPMISTSVSSTSLAAIAVKAAERPVARGRRGGS